MSDKQKALDVLHAWRRVFEAEDAAFGISVMDIVDKRGNSRPCYSVTLVWRENGKVRHLSRTSDNSLAEAAERAKVDSWKRLDAKSLDGDKVFDVLRSDAELINDTSWDPDVVVQEGGRVTVTAGEKPEANIRELREEPDPELIDGLEEVMAMARESQITSAVIFADGRDLDRTPGAVYFDFGKTDARNVIFAFEIWKAEAIEEIRG